MDTMQAYLHIPFCKRKCAYCDFASRAGCDALMAPYAGAVRREIALRVAEYGRVSLDTVYIGGGTPSIFPPELLKDILNSLFEAFPPKSGAEITCEANPGTLNEAFLRMLREQGVTRLSLGAQAGQERLLKALGRIHAWEEVEASVRLARRAGFANINLDLMFGLPGQTREDWRETLKMALALRPQHLSCYGLILEEGTPLYDRAASGTLSLPEEAEERAMYENARSLCAQAGLSQYEISNFALPGRECRHNLGYWQGAHYLGFGAAAHSRMPVPQGRAGTAYVRFGNTPVLETYLDSLMGGTLPVAEYQAISLREAEFETLMLGLRVLEGVSGQDFLSRHGRTLREAFGGKIHPLVEKGLLIYDENSLRLTRRGMDVQNAVLVELMDE